MNAETIQDRDTQYVVILRGVWPDGHIEPLILYSFVFALVPKQSEVMRNRE